MGRRGDARPGLGPTPGKFYSSFSTGEARSPFTLAVTWTSCSTNAASPRSTTCPAAATARPSGPGDPDQVSRLMPRMLLDLQNRGQLAAGHDHLQPGPRQAPRHLQADRHRHRGVPPQPPGQVRQHHGGVRRPGGHRPRPLRHLRRQRAAATPSRSSGSTAASGSGSPSPSTASSPTSPSCATSSSPTTTTTSPATSTPKSSCTTSATSCGATTGRTWSRCSATWRRSSTARTTSSS